VRRTGGAGTDAALSVWRAVFSILESVAFDTGYAGSNGLEPQSWVNGNGTSYIYFGSGEFDGQGSGHDFSGTVSFWLCLAVYAEIHGMFIAVLVCLSLRMGCPPSCPSVDVACAHVLIAVRATCSSTCPPPATSTPAMAAARTPTATTARSKWVNPHF